MSLTMVDSYCGVKGCFILIETTLNYFEEFKVVSFKCDWVDVDQGRGVNKDALSFILVSFSHLMNKGVCKSCEPFIFASQAQQVIFVQDPHDHQWFIPRKIKPEDIFDMG